MTRAANPKLLMAIAAVLASTGIATAQTPVGEVYASDASVRGSLVMTASGTRVMSGSQVAAGEHVALLRLLRGGEVRICHGTNVAMSEATIGAPLLFGINTGSLELHYPLTAISDSVVTPDFRVQITGPGVSHVALGADSKGNTCVKAMENNTTSVVVTEMMGSGSYQVASGRSVIFKEGKLDKVSDSQDVCGCPVAPPKAPAVEVAKDVPLTPAKPEEVSKTPAIVEMETPLVFAGKQVAPESEHERLIREGYTIATIRVRPVEVPAALVPSTTVAKKIPQKKKGFWGFFARLFGG